MIDKYFFALLLFFALQVSANASQRPTDFVDLHKIAPSIRYDIRYAGYHNFVGRPIRGYYAAKCLLTKPAAIALAKVQKTLLQRNLSLMVYDCYRPQLAVNDFIAWSKNSNHKMKNEFYPSVNKKDFFKLGYVAAKSGHSRGSTVDLTIVPIETKRVDHYTLHTKLVACYASYAKRFHDGGIDMGTGYDCMDKRSHPLSQLINKAAHRNRMLLRRLMQKNGFLPYEKEWWHFTLRYEPYPDCYFNVPIQGDTIQTHQSND